MVLQILFINIIKDGFKKAIRITLIICTQKKKSSHLVVVRRESLVVVAMPFSFQNFGKVNPSMTTKISIISFLRFSYRTEAKMCSTNLLAD